jgi:hypothetical protein
LARYEKGGVRTQKVTAVIGVLAILMLGAMTCVFVSDDVDGAYTNIEGSSTYSEVKKTTTFTLGGDDTYYFTASLLDSKGTVQSGKVSSSSGTLNSDFKYSLVVTAPNTAGDYYLSVTFYTDSTKDTQVSQKSAPLKVVDPVVLTAKLTNSGDIAVTFNVYFMVNGVKIDDSEQSVTVAANGTKDVTYNYIVKDLGSETKFCLQSDDKTIQNVVTGLGVTKSFYTSGNDYTWVVVLAVVIIIALFIMIVYILRKPVKNTGKPKARR